MTTNSLQKIDPMTPTVWEVTDVEQEIAGIVTLEISPESGPTPSSIPGQFNMIGLPGIGEIPISVSGVVESESRILHTIRSVGAVTAALSQLSVGDQLLVRGPFGRGWPVEEIKGKDVIIIAGGLGLAPVHPILWWMLDNRDDYGKVDVIYGARTPADLLYSSEIIGWGSSGAANLHITVDTATRGWMGNVGVVTTVIPQVLNGSSDVENTAAIVCGPDVMMRFVAPALEHIGMSEDDIYVSLERNMKCGVGLCGHCQLGSQLVCEDGPVMSWATAKDLMLTREL